MTSDLSDLLSPDFVLVDLAASSKKALFQQLGQVAGPALGLDAATVTSALAVAAWRFRMRGLPAWRRLR